MTEMTSSKPRAERKRERKRLREAARNREAFEHTPFGLKRKSHCPSAVTKVVSAIVAAGLMVWNWIRGDKAKAEPQTVPPRTDLKKAA